MTTSSDFRSTGFQPVPSNTSKLPVLLQAFDPNADVEMRQRNLPHWRLPGATYFVTFRLADALPQAKLDLLRAERQHWLANHPPPLAPADLAAFQALFSEKIEAYLAAGYGQCWLKQAPVAKLVADALAFFDTQRYVLGDYVVMPKHVHVLVKPTEGIELSDVCHSWKSYTANRINRLVGRRGTLWQEESYDHIIRDEEQLLAYQIYISENPMKAHLREGEYYLRSLLPS